MKVHTLTCPKCQQMHLNLEVTLNGVATVMCPETKAIINVIENKEHFVDPQDYNQVCAKLGVESFEYPLEQIARFGGIPRNTSYEYISTDFLNGLVNYIGCKIGFYIDRYGLARDACLANNVLEQARLTEDGPHCLIQNEDALLFGETGSDYWWLWFDQDCSDSSIDRFEKSSYGFKSFESFVCSIMEHMEDIQDNWRCKEEYDQNGAPIGEQPIFGRFKPSGWIRG